MRPSPAMRHHVSTTAGMIAAFPARMCAAKMCAAKTYAAEPGRVERLLPAFTPVGVPGLQTESARIQGARPIRGKRGCDGDAAGAMCGTTHFTPAIIIHREAPDSRVRLLNSHSPAWPGECVTGARLISSAGAGRIWPCRLRWEMTWGASAGSRP